jgi:cytochrome d ubiquinol oxidase subunit II
MPATDALPNPLAKEVVREAGAWLANYAAYPWMLAAPALGLGGAALAVLAARGDRPGWGFLFSSLALAGVILTAGFSMFPFIMPSSVDPSHSLTLWDAPSSHLTLTVMFWATIIFLPIVLAYTVWCYRQLWGKFTVQFVRDNDHAAY